MMQMNGLKTLLLLFFALVYLPSMAQTEAKKTGAEISFVEKTRNFGDIQEGEVVTYLFKFTNTGNKPLIINNVLTQCGCTATEYPVDSIAPGKGGAIRVRFNSSGKMGIQNKTATVMTNANNPMEQLVIISNVLPRTSPAK